MMQPLLLISHGAPERHEEVVPFLNNFFAGKDVPVEHIAATVQKYEHFAATVGHYSLLNSECRKLTEGIRRLCPNIPVYWGNLFWHPLLVDTVAKMAQDGIERAICFATSAFDSPAGNRRYADALESARRMVGSMAPILEKISLPFNHPLFIEAQTDRLLESLAWYLVSAPACQNSIILFSAHSIPSTDAAQSHYVEQLLSTCRWVIEKSGTTLPWELVFQSRSGQSALWLGPDINERISELAGCGKIESVIVSPIGFFCENMETEYDLDVVVGGHCAKLGLPFFRSKTVGAIQKICQLIVEHARDT